MIGRRLTQVDDTLTARAWGLSALNTSLNSVLHLQHHIISATRDLSRRRSSSTSSSIQLCISIPLSSAILSSSYSLPRQIVSYLRSQRRPPLHTDRHHSPSSLHLACRPQHILAWPGQPPTFYKRWETNINLEEHTNPHINIFGHHNRVPAPR